MTRQSKIESAVESFTLVAVGYFAGIIMQIVLFPLFNIRVDVLSTLLIGLCFSVLGFIVNYAVRRSFENYRYFKQINKGYF